jgi:hypothetical protein
VRYDFARVCAPVYSGTAPPPCVVAWFDLDWE